MSFDLDCGPEIGLWIEVELIQNPIGPVSTVMGWRKIATD
jgi:hypothetical protein